MQLEMAPGRTDTAPSQADALVLVALASRTGRVPIELLSSLRADGASVYVTHGALGCIRAVASVQARALYLDPGLPRRVVGLVRAHPNGKRLRLFGLDGGKL